MGNCKDILLEGKTSMTLLLLVWMIITITSLCFFARNGFTIDQLRLCDESTADTFIYVSLRGDVYDVSSARNSYGLGNASLYGREGGLARYGKIVI